VSDTAPSRIVLDPTNEVRPPVRERLPRLAGLEGLTLGLLDIAKPRGDVFLNRLEELFSAKGVTVKRFSKPTFTKPAPPELRESLAEQCGAVVEALAD
jgi:hypothetical protein